MREQRVNSNEEARRVYALRSFVVDMAFSILSLGLHYPFPQTIALLQVP